MSEFSTLKLPPEPHIDIVLASTPGEPFSQFIEIEIEGRSLRIGTVVQRPDGLWALRITHTDIRAATRAL